MVSTSSEWPCVSLLPGLGEAGLRPSFPIPAPLSHCAAFMSCTPVLGQKSASCWHEGYHCSSVDGWAVYCLSLCLI